MNIICEKISKKFGAVVALREVGLSIEKGEVRALLGGNGSGKSTIAKVIAGAVKPDSGSITVYGEPYIINSPVDSKKKDVVMTSQELSLLSNLSVAQNLSLCCMPTKGPITDNKKILDTAKEVLKELKIEHLLDRKIYDLAPNEKYMVEYAKALVQKPKILIIDEITSALYKEDVQIIKESIKKLKSEGCSIVFISHRMPEVFDICDTVTVMRSGQSVADFDIEEVKEITLLSLMTGKEIETEDIQGVKDYIEDKNEEIMLSIRDMKLEGFHGVDNTINIDIPAGEIVGVAGLQGHGQSNLVRQIFGMSHTPARLMISGKEVIINSPRKAAKNNLAFISGDREAEGVFKEQSISENLHVVTNLILNKKKKNDQELLNHYKVVCSGSRQKIISLSGGNQQKVVIGRWLSTNPKILLADDPTKGVDVQARTDVHKIMGELAANGSVVIMVSSDNGELVNLAKIAPKARVIIMYEGHIIQTLRGEEITEENIGKASLQMVRSEEA